MPPLRRPPQPAAKFYTGGVGVYPERELYREATFIAYYLHWSLDDILALPHGERRRFCGEISAFHSRMGARKDNPFDIGL